MTSKTKSSRGSSNRKRIKLGLPPQTESLPRGRKPETLQSFWQKRLQPWLEFANLLPVDADESSRKSVLTMEESDRLHRFVDQIVSRPFENIAYGFSGLLLPLGGRNPRVEELFILVRDVFAHCVRWTRFRANLLLPKEQELRSRDPYGFSEEYVGPVRFLVPYLVMPLGGRIISDPIISANAFRQTIEGLEIARIRQCPVADCGKFFYAVRFNTGACNDHLARARVQRGRDPELRLRYEETRRINRLVHQRVSLKDAKAEVKKKRRKRRAVQ